VKIGAGMPDSSHLFNLLMTAAPQCAGTLTLGLGAINRVFKDRGWQGKESLILLCIHLT